ncbi:MAG: beta-lactamase family protein [Bacteroidetes bacterium]|nr:beta-lactamase family protein [Bacteroidota bacterium]
MFKYKVIICFIFLSIVNCNIVDKANSKLVEIDTSYFLLNDTFKAFNKKFIDSINDYFSHDFHGTVLIAKGNKIYTKAYGFADLQEKEPMHLDNIFQLASVSKTVTGISTLVLAQQGKINIDSSLSFYLKDFPHNNVSIRSLLSHRSGLANYMYYTDTFWRDTSKCLSSKEWYDFYCKYKPIPYLQPNVSFSYCNTNFTLLAILIEKVSGITFPKFVEENVFKPCGMKHSFYYGFEHIADKDKIVTGRLENFEYKEKYYLDGVLGDKSLFSTVQDMFLFHRGLLDGRLINAQNMQLIQTPTYDYNLYGGSYGLGFRLKNYPNGQWVYHNGWWRGFWTFFWNRFDKKACFVILTNNKKSSHIDEQKIGEWLLEAN